MKIWRPNSYLDSPGWGGVLLATIPMPIKRRWFDMIRVGVKDEEYRSLRWREQILRHCQEANSRNLCPCLELINGYGAQRPRILVQIGIIETRLAWDIPPMHPEWGEQPVDRIAIHLRHVFSDLEGNLISQNRGDGNDRPVYFGAHRANGLTRASVDALLASPKAAAPRFRKAAKNS